MGERRVHAMGLGVGLVSSIRPIKRHLTQRHSSSLDSSLTIIFTLVHDSSLGDKYLGEVNISMQRLLELQHLQPNEGEYHCTIDIDAMIDNLTI
jgi:hypothetical protein